MPWIFAYGSLMWRPGFSFEEQVRGTLHGYHRDFTVAATTRWGTAEHPAPTLGLEEGGSCDGIAYRVDEEDFSAAMLYLREREGDGTAFPRCAVELDDGRGVTAVVALHEEDERYIGDLPADERVAMAVNAAGPVGTGVEHVLNTQERIRECGISDGHVDVFAQCVRDLQEQQQEQA